MNPVIRSNSRPHWYAASVLLLFFMLSASAQQPTEHDVALRSGGGIISGGAFEIETSFGGWEAGLLEGTQYTIEGGFWPFLFDCSIWTGASAGDFADAANWSDGIPNANSVVCLDRGGEVLTTIHFPHWSQLPEGIRNDEFYTVAGLEIRSGSWAFDLRYFTTQFGSVPKTFQCWSDLVVGPNSKLIISNGTVSTPNLILGTNVVIGSGNGTLRVENDLLLTNAGSEIAFELQRGVNTDIPLLAVGKTFRAGGKLRLLTAPGYVPQPGDRFRLVEFAAETNDVQKIYDFYRFKDYDPTIPGPSGSMNFWGLIFREDGKQFIEAVVLRKPRFSTDGPPLTPSPGQPGLVFVTHGTRSEIKTSLNDSTGLGALAELIQTFTASHGAAQWQTATFDWRELSTGFLDTEFPVFNPATSAQFGIGLGESVVHWMQVNGFHHQKFHLLSHSSGSWFVNRMMQLLAGTADVHVTFFDAFTPPGQSSGCDLGPFFCNRFSDELGKGGGNAFVEHYVDRSWWELWGTGSHLDRAINIDVTRGTNSSPPPESSVCCWPPTAHSWPYQWYLHTVRVASAGGFNSDHFECSGFGLSREFRESTVFNNNPVFASQYQRAKRTFSLFGPASELVLVGQSCFFIRQPLYKPYAEVFRNADTRPEGQYEFLSFNQLLMRAVFGSPLKFIANSPSAHLAGATCSITNTQTVVGLKFDFQFTEGTNAILTVLVNGEVQRQILQDTIGNVNLNSGEIRVVPPLHPGTHQIEFRLETASAASVGVNISHVELGYDTGPSLAVQPESVGGNLEWMFVGAAGKTNYSVEGSSDLMGWTTVTNMSGAGGLFMFQTPATEPHRFFRIVAP